MTEAGCKKRGHSLKGSKKDTIYFRRQGRFFSKYSQKKKAFSFVLLRHTQTYMGLEKDPSRKKEKGVFLRAAWHLGEELKDKFL